MKIDLTPSHVPELDRGVPNCARAPRATASGVGAEGEDVAQFSSGSDVIDGLRAHLAQVPDVRQARVMELRQVISEGRYVISPESIADGMLASSVFSR